MQGFQVIEQMVHRMAFHLSGEVHLNNNTAKAYLCNQGSTVSLSFQTNLLHIEFG